MGLRDKAAAFNLIERAMAVMSIIASLGDEAYWASNRFGGTLYVLKKDPIFGRQPIEILARVAAQIGEADRAIAALQKLLSIPHEGALPVGNAPLTAALLRLDPMVDPLRNDPRFQKLLVSPAP